VTLEMHQIRFSTRLRLGPRGRSSRRYACRPLSRLGGGAEYPITILTPSTHMRRLVLGASPWLGGGFAPKTLRDKRRKGTSLRQPANWRRQFCQSKESPVVSSRCKDCLDYTSTMTNVAILLAAWADYTDIHPATE